MSKTGRTHTPSRPQLNLTVICLSMYFSKLRIFSFLGFSDCAEPAAPPPPRPPRPPRSPRLAPRPPRMLARSDIEWWWSWRSWQRSDCGELLGIIFRWNELRKLVCYVDCGPCKFVCAGARAAGRRPGQCSQDLLRPGPSGKTGCRRCVGARNSRSSKTPERHQELGGRRDCCGGRHGRVGRAAIGAADPSHLSRLSKSPTSPIALLLSPGESVPLACPWPLIPPLGANALFLLRPTGKATRRSFVRVLPTSLPTGRNYPSATQCPTDSIPHGPTGHASGKPSGRVMWLQTGQPSFREAD